MASSPMLLFAIHSIKRVVRAVGCHGLVIVLVIGSTVTSSFFPYRVVAAEEAPAGGPTRTRWTTSRVVGSPDPPLPYTVEKFADWVQWKRPLYVIAEPGTRQLLVVEQGGEQGQPSRILRLAVDAAPQPPTELLVISGRLIYSVMPHPDYGTNGWLFVFTNGPTGESERTNRISRFTVRRESPFDVDLASESVILEWRSMGHDGGDIAFGNDRMLYISTGDGTSDSDGWVSGQDVTNLLGAILRIDIEHPDEGRKYGIPRDNPFLHLPEARGEIWAFGLRNPWRMSVDRATGQLWVGNNGQDLWETAHLVRRGDNYGWSVYEGNHPFYLHRQLGPAPFVPPTLEHHHREARSLTGGVTYRGDKLPKLAGAYCYGDYSTGKIWSARHDGTRVTEHQEIADTTLQIAGLGLSVDGDLLVVDHGTGLYRLVPNDMQVFQGPFPQRLSDTGVFLSTADHEVATGIVPYEVNVPGWADGAKVARFLGLPGDAKVEYAEGNGWKFPEGTVVVQTLSLPVVGRDGEQIERRIETRLLTKQLSEWAGYSYRWNADQRDAVLVEKNGSDETLNVITDSGDVREQTWHYPGRAECMSCHSRAANYILGLTSQQIDRAGSYATGAASQLQHLAKQEVFASPVGERDVNQTRLADPYNAELPLEQRARSYLHVNCSCCHVEAGGGNSRMQLDYGASPERMNVVEAFPQHDTLGVLNGLVVAPGEPERSMMFQRVSRRGRGQMPPIVTRVVDERGRDLLHAWIASMERHVTFVSDWTVDELRSDLDTGLSTASVDSGRRLFVMLQCVQCHKMGDEGGGVGPNLTGIGKRVAPLELLESIVEPSRKVAPEFASSVIHTVDGRTLEGRIESENDQSIMLRLSGSTGEPIQIPARDIEERTLTTRSTMPTDLVNRLERAAIMDLLKYVVQSGEE